MGCGLAPEVAQLRLDLEAAGRVHADERREAPGGEVEAEVALDRRGASVLVLRVPLGEVVVAVAEGRLEVRHDCSSSAGDRTAARKKSRRAVAEEHR